MLRLIANGVIAFFVLWTLAVSVAEFIGVTIHFPWVIAGVNEIPLHRLQSLRVAILLTFAHYGVLHLFGKNQEHFRTILELSEHFWRCLECSGNFWEILRIFRYYLDIS